MGWWSHFFQRKDRCTWRIPGPREGYRVKEGWCSKVSRLVPDIVVSEHAFTIGNQITCGFRRLLSNFIQEASQWLLDADGKVSANRYSWVGYDRSWWGVWTRLVFRCVPEDWPQQMTALWKKIELTRTCTREIGTSPLQSGYAARSICVDIERHFYGFHGSVQGRYQRIRDSQEETR